MNTKTKSAEEKRLAAIRAHHARNCSVINAARFHQAIIRFDGKEKGFPKATKFETFLQFLIDHPTATVWVLNEDTMKLEPLMGFVPWTATDADASSAAEPEPERQQEQRSERISTEAAAAPVIENDNEEHHEEEIDEQISNEISIPTSERPCYRVFEKWTSILEHGNRPPGVFFFGSKTKGDEVINTCEEICSPLYIDAIASDEQDNNYGRVVRFVNPKKKWRTWAMPMEMLAGSGEDLRAELLAMGVIINPEAKQRLSKYVSDEEPKRHVRCATQVGWCGGASFVLPTAVIGPAAANVIFQSGERGQAEYGRRGTMEGWQTSVAARAVGNPVLMMAIAAAFVGPLLEKVNGESGGIHLVDNSSVGKSTAIKASASVWGGPKHVRSWNATANGMEGVAALFNDNLLPLDEISECAARDINRIVYALANGVGKQRASRSGAARGVVRWKCFVLSSGERMIETELLNDGINPKAGQLVRIVDLPVARQHGVWDDLQDLSSGEAFSNAIKDAVAKHHGHAGVAFLERLMRDARNWADELEDVKRLREFEVEGDAGQDKRVAARFALVAMAGETASEYGIVPWPAGAATKAAAIMFRTWQNNRKQGNKEPQQILERLAAFIQRHGDSRFSAINDYDGRGAMVRDRAGWWEPADQEGRLYWFTPDGLREAQGFDFERALNVLIEAAIMPTPRTSAKGTKASQKKINGENMRVYQICSARLIA